MPRTVHADLETIDEVAEIASDHNIALQVLGQGGRVNDFAYHALDSGSPDVERSMEVPGMDHDRKKLADRIAVALGEGLAPVTMGQAPGVLPAAASKGVKLEACRAQPEDAVLVEAHDTPGGLHSGKGMQSLAEEELAAGRPGKRVDVLMGVTCSEASEENLPGIGSIIAISISQKDEILSLSEVDPSVSECESGRHV